MRTAQQARSLPRPATRPPWGHLSRWTGDALTLLEEGAALGPVFRLRLWRSAFVGYTPEWNRFILTNIEQFRSRGSLSQLSPYLSAGVVALDAPGHRARRAELNPSFHRRMMVSRFDDDFAELAAALLPTGEFDAVAWASEVVTACIVRAFVGQQFPPGVLKAFLRPLDRPMPGPLLPRPIKIRRMQRALRHSFTDPDPTTLTPLFAQLTDGAEEARVALAAAYDTTAHALAFGLWELAGHPQFNDPSLTSDIVSETLRLYPSGWIGSRVSNSDIEFDELRVPAGTMVLYSPYLTHRSPEVWEDPLVFRPERFTGSIPAWGYLPFSAGERTCLGAAMATTILRAAVAAFSNSTLRRVSGDGRPRGSLTLTPRGPLILSRTM